MFLKIKLEPDYLVFRGDKIDFLRNKPEFYDVTMGIMTGFSIDTHTDNDFMFVKYNKHNFQIGHNQVDLKEATELKELLKNQNEYKGNIRVFRGDYSLYKQLLPFFKDVYIKFDITDRTYLVTPNANISIFDVQM